MLPLTLDPDVDLFSRNDASRESAWQRAIGPDSRVARILQGTAARASTSPSTRPCSDRILVPRLRPGLLPGRARPGHPDAERHRPATPATPATPDAPGTGTTPATTPTTAPTTSPTTQGTPPSQAAATIGRLGDELETQLGGRSVWALPYADADVAATVAVDPSNSLVRDLVTRASTLATRLGQPARADIVWPVDGLMPAGREQGIQTLLSGTSVKKAAGIVVNAAAVSRTTAYTPTARRVTAAGTRLLAYDPRLSALLPARTDPSPVLSIQRYLAETLVLLGERAGTPRSVLVTAPRTYDPDGVDLATFLAATSSAPWLEPVDAASLLSDSGTEQAVEQARPATPVASAAPPPVLNARRLTQMAEQRDTLLSVSSVLRDGDEFERTYREVLDELASARWRYQPGSWATLSDLGGRATSGQRRARSAVVPRTSTINLLAENGTLRITVENGLDYTVEDIRLRLVPDNPRIRVVEQPGPVTIGPLVTHERPRRGRRRRRRPRRDPRLPHDRRRHPDRLAGHDPPVGQPARRRHLLGRRDPRRPRPAGRRHPRRRQGHLTRRRDRRHRGTHRGTRVSRRCGRSG